MTSIRKKLLPGDSGVISLVGAGGKTTLMFALARELAEAGETVLTTTTTKIFVPSQGQSPNLVVSAVAEEVLEKSRDLLEDSFHVTAAREHLVSQGKLAGFEPHVINVFREAGLFRWILVEADGAAQRPLKAPASYEPVIPQCSTCVIAVVGLDAVGERLDDRCVFRPRLYSQITGLPPGAPVTEQSVAAIILDEEGLMRGCPSEARRCAFLNKAEEERALKAGRKIGAILQEDGKGKLERILIGSARQDPPFVELFDAETD